MSYSERERQSPRASCHILDVLQRERERDSETAREREREERERELADIRVLYHNPIPTVSVSREGRGVIK